MPTDDEEVWIRTVQNLMHTGVYYLFRAVNKNAIQYEVGPEQRPLTLDVLKQLQLCRFVIQSVWILEKQRNRGRDAGQEQYIMLYYDCDI